MKFASKMKILRPAVLGLALLCMVLAFPLAALAADDTSSTVNGEEAATQQPEGTPSLSSMYTPDFELQAAGAYLVNEESGVVIYEKNADTPMTAASLVKVMTSILAMEMVDDLDNTFITAEAWVFDELYGKNASHADIRRGETLSVRELLYAMLLPSANEAALMVAGYLGGGSTANFVQMMNEKARALGCTGTTFADPNGLSEDNLTTPRDMYLIFKEFMKHSTLVEIASTDTYQVEAHESHSAPYNVFNTNRILVTSTIYYTMASAARGSMVAGKTGSLGEWQNFACATEKNGMTYYSVILHSPNEADEYAAALGAYRPALIETQQLLDWAYSSFSIRSALDTNKAIHQIRIRYSTTDDEIKLLPTDDLKTILPVDASDSDIQRDFTNLPEWVDAPVKQGDVIGTVTLSLYGEVIGVSTLVAAKDVDRNTTLYMVEKFKEFFGTWYFKLILVLVVVGVLLYIAITVLLNSQKRKKARRR